LPNAIAKSRIPMTIHFAVAVWQHLFCSYIAIQFAKSSWQFSLWNGIAKSIIFLTRQFAKCNCQVKNPYDNSFCHGSSTTSLLLQLNCNSVCQINNPQLMLSNGIGAKSILLLTIQFANWNWCQIKYPFDNSICHGSLTTSLRQLNCICQINCFEDNSVCEMKLPNQCSFWQFSLSWQFDKLILWTIQFAKWNCQIHIPFDKTVCRMQLPNQ
jgi:hypothetical protein